LKSIFKISLTGPESSGKTSLAQLLSDFFQLPMVPEYARNFLLLGGTVKNIADLIRLAHGQIKLENQNIQHTDQGIICDTDLLVLKVWCLEKFKRVPIALKTLYLHHRYDLTLLCKPDIEWQADPLRENPGDRDRLFAIYFRELQKLNANFKVIEGKGNDRSQQAIKIVEDYLKHR